MRLANETSPAFGPLDSSRIVGKPERIRNIENAACGYAARRISSTIRIDNLTNRENNKFSREFRIHGKTSRDQFVCQGGASHCLSELDE